MKRLVAFLMIIITTFTLSYAVGCAPTEHTDHVWASAWSKDETMHYKKCTHSGCVEVSQMGLHSYENGSCTICGQLETVSSGHICTWNNDWSFDETYHYKECTNDNCDGVDEKGLHAYSGEGEVDVDNLIYSNNCEICKNTVRVNMEEVYQTTIGNINNANSGAVIYISGGAYSNVNISGLDNVTIIADDYAFFNKFYISGCENVTLINLNFENDDHTIGMAGNTWGGILLNDADVEGLKIYNCTFTGNTGVFSENDATNVKNIVIDGCSFTEIRPKDESRGRTSILIHCVENLTVNNCVFDDIGYNAIQIGSGNGYVNGLFKFTNNSISNTFSRPMRIAGTSTGLTCDISGNTFYELVNSDNHYIKNSNTIATIVFGVNKFEVEPSSDNFNGNVTINIAEQQIIG